MSAVSGSDPAATPTQPGDHHDLVLEGMLHLFVAFDWGDEVDLEQASRLVPAEVFNLARRRRTPTSIAYRPSPLRFPSEPVVLHLPELGSVQVVGEATVFDFAAVSVAFHVPFRLSQSRLSRLAGWFADSGPLAEAARTALVPLHQRLLPAIQKPGWRDDLSEEYIVFDLPPPAPTLEAHAEVLSALVRLETGRLSQEEITEAIRLHLSYNPHDLFIADWAAAILYDEDCDETLQTIEYANLQLLEFRHIDDRLDASLAEAYRLTFPLRRSWPTFWRIRARPLLDLGGLKVEANGLFERTENVLKLVGDQYLARIYRLLAARFHLQEWEESIQRKLEVAEGIYQVLSDQAASYRTEFLEIIVIGLILFEIILALFRH